MTITTRIDNITNIDELHRGTIIRAPNSVKIELTARCNFRCSFCASVQRLRDKQDMDFDLYKNIVKELAENGVQELGLFYLGESFLYPHLAESILYAKSVGIKYAFLTTNGSIAYQSNVDRCIHSGLDSLKFSLNYTDESQFSDIARVNPKLFHRIFDNIRGAKEARDRVYEETGHKCGLYGSYIQYDSSQHEKMLPVIENVTPYLDEVYALPLYNQAALVPNSNAVAGNLGRIGALRTPIPCWSVFTEGHITWDGKLSACCFDHDGRFEMGDLTKDPFMDCWNSKKFIAIRSAHLNGDVTNTVCEKCVAWV